MIKFTGQMSYMTRESIIWDIFAILGMIRKLRIRLSKIMRLLSLPPNWGCLLTSDGKGPRLSGIRLKQMVTEIRSQEPVTIS